VWAPRIQAISQAWQDVEIESVKRGLRPCALISTTKAVYHALPHPLQGLSLGNVPAVEGYTSAARAPRLGESTQIRGVVGIRLRELDAFEHAYQAGDNKTQAQLLGYPACCAEFFDRVWVKERWMDTTWPMIPSIRNEPFTYKIAAQGPHGANPIVNMYWRYLGVRPVFHLPCDHGCGESIKIATALRELLPPDERAWMTEILSWPVEWTALHGIGELRTPILRCSFATDATRKKLTIEYHSEQYPQEGATGVKFPLRTPQQSVGGINRATFFRPSKAQERFFLNPERDLKLTFDNPRQSTASRAENYSALLGTGLAPVKEISEQEFREKFDRLHDEGLSKRWSLTVPTIPPHLQARKLLADPAANGFQSMQAMKHAHHVLLAFLRDVSPLAPFDRVVDLGCGDGTLLAQIPARRRIGVDERAVGIIPEEVEFYRMTIADWFSHPAAWWKARPTDLYLCALERFEEEMCHPLADHSLRRELHQCSVLVYSYAPADFTTRAVNAFGVQSDLIFDDDPACQYIFLSPLRYTESR
jgi:hypothetical protein